MESLNQISPSDLIKTKVVNLDSSEILCFELFVYSLKQHAQYFTLFSASIAKFL